jgi:stage II sporulation protein P
MARLTAGEALPRRVLLFCAAVLLLLLAAQPPARADEADETGQAVTIADQHGRPLLVTGLDVAPGDRFIDEANRLWDVISRSGNQALARAAGTVDLRLTPQEEALLGARIQQAGLLGGGGVAVFHTHNAEAYEPTEGAPFSSPAGGVLRVGNVLAAALRDLGVEAVHDRTSHLPHDRLAYSRSRRTLTYLMTSRAPAAAFDLHRDTAPAAAYTATIDGRQTARVMIVIGRANPSMEANLAFAKRVKTRVDEEYPGLLRAIYYGKGHYNQDLFPRLLLLEAGTYENTRAEAERAMRLFARAVAPLLQAGPGLLALPELEEKAGEEAENRGAWRAIIAWAAAALLLGGSFVVISHGGAEPAMRQLNRLLGRDGKGSDER